MKIISIEIISGWTDIDKTGEPSSCEATYKIKAIGIHHAKLPAILKAQEITTNETSTETTAR